MNTYKTFGINFFGFVFNITNINKDKSSSLETLSLLDTFLR